MSTNPRFQLIIYLVVAIFSLQFHCGWLVGYLFSYTALYRLFIGSLLHSIVDIYLNFWISGAALLYQTTTFFSFFLNCCFYFIFSFFFFFFILPFLISDHNKTNNSCIEYNNNNNSSLIIPFFGDVTNNNSFVCMRASLSVPKATWLLINPK